MGGSAIDAVAVCRVKTGLAEPPDGIALLEYPERSVEAGVRGDEVGLLVSSFPVGVG